MRAETDDRDRVFLSTPIDTPSFCEICTIPLVYRGGNSNTVEWRDPREYISIQKKTVETLGIGLCSLCSKTAFLQLRNSRFLKDRRNEDTQALVSDVYLQQMTKCIEKQSDLDNIINSSQKSFINMYQSLIQSNSNSLITGIDDSDNKESQSKSFSQFASKIADGPLSNLRMRTKGDCGDFLIALIPDEDDVISQI